MSSASRPIYGLFEADYRRRGYQGVYGQEKLSASGGILLASFSIMVQCTKNP
jgi:hypothetical protein